MPEPDLRPSVLRPSFSEAAAAAAPSPATSVNEVSDGNGLVNKFTSQSL